SVGRDDRVSASEEPRHLVGEKRSGPRAVRGRRLDDVPSRASAAHAYRKPLARPQSVGHRARRLCNPHSERLLQHGHGKDHDEEVIVACATSESHFIKGGKTVGACREPRITGYPLSLEEEDCKTASSANPADESELLFFLTAHAAPRQLALNCKLR